MVFRQTSQTYSPHSAQSFFLAGQTLLSTDFQITILTDASENLDSAKPFYLYIAKMPFALSLCRRCSYSFTTSSGLSKDAAIVISQYNRTTRKQCSHIQEDLRFGPRIANLIPLSYRIFCTSQEKTAAKSLFSKIESFPS